MDRQCGGDGDGGGGGGVSALSLIQMAVLSEYEYRNEMMYPNTELGPITRLACGKGQTQYLVKGQFNTQTHRETLLLHCSVWAGTLACFTCGQTFISLTSVYFAIESQKKKSCCAARM